MARIRIKDLPWDRKISRAEMKGITGGFYSDIYYANYQKSQELAEQLAEEAKDRADSAKEQYKMALRTISETEERKTQNVSVMTRA